MSTRWWVDIANAPNVTVFRPIVRRLLERGDQVIVTVWDRGQARALTFAEWPDAVVVGTTGFRTPAWAKGTAIFDRAVALAREMRRREFDVALGHASNAQVMAARMLRRPSVNMMDYEHHPANHVGFRFADLVMVPEAVPYRAVRKFGLSPSRYVPYPGLKEEIAVSLFEPDPGFKEQLGIAPGEVTVVIRPAAEGALYHRHENSLCSDVLERSVDYGATVLLSPRTTSQAAMYEGRPGVRVLTQPVSGPDLLYWTDMVVGAGGSMTREAAVLGTPTYSIFQGKPAAVDQWLVERGRLSILSDADALPKPVLRESRSARTASPAALDRFMDLLHTRVQPLLRARGQAFGHAPSAR